jgi:tripartite-type tricarboxylate transporter receptor subunit TctC
MLAATSAKRLPGWEQVPCLAELLTGVDMVGWFAIVAPSGTPEPAIARVDRDVNPLLKDQVVAGRIETLGPIADGGMTIDQVSAFLRKEHTRWAQITREIGALPE